MSRFTPARSSEHISSSVKTTDKCFSRVGEILRYTSFIDNTHWQKAIERHSDRGPPLACERAFFMVSAPVAQSTQLPQPPSNFMAAGGVVWWTAAPHLLP